MNWYFIDYLTDTKSVTRIVSKAILAGAHETSESVGAVSVFTQVLMFFTFINVFQYHLQNEPSLIIKNGFDQIIYEQSYYLYLWSPNSMSIEASFEILITRRTVGSR